MTATQYDLVIDMVTKEIEMLDNRIKMAREGDVETSIEFSRGQLYELQLIRSMKLGILGYFINQKEQEETK